MASPQKIPSSCPQVGTTLLGNDSGSQLPSFPKPRRDPSISKAPPNPRHGSLSSPTPRPLAPLPPWPWRCSPYRAHGVDRDWGRAVALHPNPCPSPPPGTLPCLPLAPRPPQRMPRCSHARSSGTRVSTGGGWPLGAISPRRSLQGRRARRGTSLEMPRGRQQGRHHLPGDACPGFGGLGTRSSAGSRAALSPAGARRCPCAPERAGGCPGREAHSTPRVPWKKGAKREERGGTSGAPRTARLTRKQD